MDLTVSSYTRVATLAFVLAVFAVVGWRMGAPESFNATLAHAGLAPQQTAAVAPAPAAPAPQTPTPATGDSTVGH